MAYSLATSMVRKSLDVFLEAAEGSDRLASAESRELLATAEMIVLSVEKLWLLIEESIDRGLEKKHLILSLKEFQDVLELAPKALTLAQRRINAVNPAPQERGDAAGMFERVVVRFAEMRGRIAQVLTWLESPRPDVDINSLPGERGELRTGGHVSHDELMGQLTAGNDR